ncbi:MAG: glycosyltransferase family 9 protein [Planctomycetota bacterium]|jgi:ADP-heptose:LPS heptosyltransferase
MELTFPGLCFLTSSIPLKFDTDGYTTSFQPAAGSASDLEHVLVLTNIQVKLFGLASVQGISLFSSITVPEKFETPEIYDGRQDLGGKRILILMLNGWGDMIHIQPALRAFYEKAKSSAAPPRITLGCNWMHNFPYPGVPFIHDIRPNILTLKDLSAFDLIVNLIPVNHQRSEHKSMKDLCLEVMKLNGKDQEAFLPSITPDTARVARFKPVLEQIKEDTGKKLLCVNWKSRFPHKNAQPSLVFEAVKELSKDYQAVLFKDAEPAKIMQQEIDADDCPVMNLSYLINDYHDTIAALSLMDAFVSVDTGIVHAAGALGVPGVALFGPFPPATHVSDYPSVLGLRTEYSGEACSGPCLETHRGCAEVNYSQNAVSPCFKAITPENVVEVLKEIVT